MYVCVLGPYTQPHSTQLGMISVEDGSIYRPSMSALFIYALFDAAGVGRSAFTAEASRHSIF